MEKFIAALIQEITELEHQLQLIEQALASGTLDRHDPEILSLDRVEIQSQLADLIMQKQLLDSPKKKGWPLHHTNSWLVLWGE